MKMTKTMHRKKIPMLLLFTISFCFCAESGFAQDKLTFEDVMQFKEIQQPVLSPDAEWVGYGVWPERGDGETILKETDGNGIYTIERGTRPAFNYQSNRAFVYVQPPFIETENAEKDKPQQSLVLVNLENGSQESFENAERAEFSNDGNWLMITHHQPEDVKEHKSKNPSTGNPVTLVHLDSNRQTNLDFVHEASIDSTSAYLAYSVADTSGNENALYSMELADGDNQPVQLRSKPFGYYNNLTWDHKRERLAFTESELDTANKFLPSDAQLTVWSAPDDEMRVVAEPDESPENYRFRSNNNLTWSHDGNRLFYGLMDAKMVQLEEQKPDEDSLTSENLYDTGRVLDDVESMVWHWDDPLIKTHEKNQWNREKNKLYMAVYHFDEDRSVQLSDFDMPDISITQNTTKLIGSSDLPYRKLITWDGWYRDYYVVDTKTGSREQIQEKQRFGASLSPDGNFITWFNGEDWFLKNLNTDAVQNLTEEISTPFYNEDNDRPEPAGSYGVAGWTEDDRAVMIYDKYDIWQFDTSDGSFFSVTDGAGRSENKIFRIYDLDPETPSFESNERLLLTMYHDMDKNYGFYEARAGRSGVSRVMEEEKKFSILEKARESDAILFTAEKYDEYPNLYLAGDRRFRNPEQLTNLYEDLNDRWDWGHAELVEWLNADGRKVQGVLIYPGDYDPEKRYPVLVYYYSRFSQRLHDFNHPFTNHRPVFAQYASDGYAVFLPDIWFDIGEPGYSATKNLVPGVQRLVEMGVADPDGLGLHGHSWSGYQTAFVITQTDIFSAAVAGAPVSNMTSAYSGIRWGSGLARQFQYEQSQSRLGVSMWENLQPYIENSPVFFADRINTPLLLQFGDDDGAVPWYQGIEMYLAMRRLQKDAVFLHYKGEPHHLQKYPNKLDYAIKMKEYFDHYLKGTPAPKWITDGVPYRGE